MILDYVSGPNAITGVLVRGRQEGQGQRRGCDFRSRGHRDSSIELNRSAAGFGDGGFQAEACRQPLQAGSTGTGSPLEPSEGAQPCRHLILVLLTFSTVREYICAVLSHSFAVTRYSSSRKLIQWLEISGEAFGKKTLLHSSHF